MRVDASLSGPIRTIGDRAAEFEKLGYSGVWTAEIAHDPFLPLAQAARTTSDVELGTSIAVAFARNPMLLANIGWDLQAISGGRFAMGLGSQIEAHITKRFGMPWSRPAARMKEMIEAIRAIWDCWLQGNPLQFRGEFYQHTLMTPFFSPDASDVAAFGVPKIFLAGVGERMTEAAGEVCDGFLCHSFTTESYLREVTIPSLARGRERAGKTMDGFEIRGPGFVVTGDSEEDMQAATTAVRGQIAFYASTPAYRGVLDHHGWGELQSELNAMSKRGEWSDMGSLITDDILNAFAVVAPPDEVARELGRRFADVSNRIALYAPYKRENSWWMPIVKELESL